MNNIILIGRLTAAPELKTTTSGNNVTTFNIAVERRYSGKDGERQTDFITCVAWRNTAEFVTKHFKKGDPIAIQGELQTRKYTDKDGNNRVAVEVQVNDARFVPTKKSDNSGNNDSTPASFSNANNNDFAEISDIDDDLPF